MPAEVVQRRGVVGTGVSLFTTAFAVQSSKHLMNTPPPTTVCGGTASQPRYARTTHRSQMRSSWPAKSSYPAYPWSSSTIIRPRPNGSTVMSWDLPGDGARNRTVAASSCQTHPPIQPSASACTADGAPDFGDWSLPSIKFVISDVPFSDIRIRVAGPCAKSHCPGLRRAPVPTRSRMTA